LTAHAPISENAYRGYQLLPASLPRTRTLLTTRRRWRNRVSVRRRALGRAHYNYFRDYDPAVARYVESDPIGLKGGINTYAYAAQSPARYVDQTGAFPMKMDSACWALRAKVILYCKTLPRRCGDNDSCSTLRFKAITNQLCAISQIQLTRQCYPDDPTHGQVVQDAFNGARRCYERIALKCYQCPAPY
jgi:RHS repeat-associated protein